MPTTVVIHIPEDILKLQTKLLRLMASDQVEAYRAKFSALNPEGDYSKVIHQWLIFLLADENSGAYKFTNERTKAIMNTTLDSISRRLNGEIVPPDEVEANIMAGWEERVSYAVVAASHVADFNYHNHAIIMADKLLQLMETK